MSSQLKSASRDAMFGAALMLLSPFVATIIGALIEGSTGTWIGDHLAIGVFLFGFLLALSASDTYVIEKSHGRMQLRAGSYNRFRASRRGTETGHDPEMNDILLGHEKELP